MQFAFSWWRDTLCRVSIAPLTCTLSPDQMLERWPPAWPLAALCFGEPDSPRRCTIFARPASRLTDAEAEARLAKPLSTSYYDPALPIFTGGLIGVASYDQGAQFEPKARSPRRAAKANPWPRMAWFDCLEAFVYQHHTRQWWRLGDIDIPSPCQRPGRPWHVGEVRSSSGREGYIAGVRRVLEYIRAGDVYQVNLAHRLHAAFQGSPRALFGAMLAGEPWYGGYLDWLEGEHEFALVSQSPELFLEYEPVSRSLVTRPMKGTRPAGQHASLLTSPKDRAELAMIVDLMRNDLGRVCELGSVRVEIPRTIERHGAGPGAILQATATVLGTLPADASMWQVLRATFPGGSVTGAPKVRAMQIIDELEPVSRGPYCGCLGFVSDSGHAMFNLAIRTALVHGEGGVAGERTLTYSVGAGIVADSEPEREWEETMQKAAGFLHVLGRPSEAWRDALHQETMR